jgi:hypothetical protein
MSTIAATPGLPGLTAPAKTTAPSGDDGAFAALLGAAPSTPVAPAVSGGTAQISTGLQAGLLQLQAGSSGDPAGEVTALSGLGGRVDPTQERQFLQTWGADFAHSMDANGDGEVTKDELVGTLNAKGGLPTDLGSRLFGILAPGGGDALSDNQLAAEIANGFAPVAGKAT